VGQKMDENQTAVFRTYGNPFLGLTAIGIKNAKEAVPVVVWLLFFHVFIRLKKKENPRGHAYLCILL